MSLRKRPDRMSDLVFLVFALSILVGGYVFLQSGITGRSVVSNTGAAPLVHMMSPEENANITVRNISLICNVSSANLSSVSIYTNISGIWAITKHVIVSGNSYKATLNITEISDGNYVWNCVAKDVSNYTASAPQNRSFTVDASPPDYLGELTSMASPATYGYGVNYTFSINWTDALSGIDSVWLVLRWMDRSC